MLYLGHFEVITREYDFLPDSDSGKGYFTCIVESEDVVGAMDKFSALIEELHSGNEEFSRIERVRMYSCIEIKRLPESGLLAHYVQKTEDFQPLRTFWLPRRTETSITRSDVVETEAEMGMGWDLGMGWGLE